MTTSIFNWGNLLTGIQFILGLQLIVISIFLIFKKKIDQKTYLGLFCLIEGLWYFKRVFYGYWHEDILMYLLIGEGKPIFIGSLLLFYCKSFSSNVRYTYLMKHLWAPLLLYISLMFTLFFPFTTYSNDERFTISLIILIFGEIITWTYFFLVRKELIKNVRKKLIPKAYKKVMILFYSFYFFSLQITFWDLYTKLVEENRLPESIRVQAIYLYESFFKYIAEDLSYIYLHLFDYFLFIYAVSEVLYFKKFFLPRNATIDEKVISGKSKIDQLMQRYLEEEKVFTNPHLKLSTYANIIGITKKELIDYFKLVGIDSFKNYIDEFRVQEFKNLVKDKSYNNYDLVSLGKECGFNSKTTFFRVFKKIEGTTPNAYKKAIMK